MARKAPQTRQDRSRSRNVESIHPPAAGLTAGLLARRAPGPRQFGSDPGATLPRGAVSSVPRPWHHLARCRLSPGGRAETLRPAPIDVTWTFNGTKGGIKRGIRGLPTYVKPPPLGRRMPSVAEAAPQGQEPPPDPSNRPPTAQLSFFARKPGLHPAWHQTPLMSIVFFRAPPRRTGLRRYQGIIPPPTLEGRPFLRPASNDRIRRNPRHARGLTSIVNRRPLLTRARTLVD
jgi:hypothetical protein